MNATAAAAASRLFSTQGFAVPHSPRKRLVTQPRLSTLRIRANVHARARTRDLCGAGCSGGCTSFRADLTCESCLRFSTAGVEGVSILTWRVRAGPRKFGASDGGADSRDFVTTEIAHL